MRRGAYDLFQQGQRRLVRALLKQKELKERVELLMTIPGVGEITALTWALEIADPSWFSSRGRVLSFCGLTSAPHASAGKELRGPISKNRNKHLQAFRNMLVKANDLAEQGEAKRAYVQLMEARKLVGYFITGDAIDDLKEMISEVLYSLRA